MRSTRKTVAVALLLSVLATAYSATVVHKEVNTQRHSINVSIPESNGLSTSRYNLIAEYDSGYLTFNISTLKEGPIQHHAHVWAVPFYNNSDNTWSSSVHLLQFYANGQQSRIYQFNMTHLIRNLNNYGPGPCEKMNDLYTEVVCRFNFSVASQWIPLFVSIKYPNQEPASLKILGKLASDGIETPELSYGEYWRVSNLIKKANLRVLYNEPKSIMEVRWNGNISESADFKKLKPTKISFQSERYNSTTAWQGSSKLQPTSYLFFSNYIFSEKDCQVWCDVTLILTDPESPGSFYPVQILKYRNPYSRKNFMIVGGFIAFAFLVVFVCWVTRSRRNKRRPMAEMSHFNEVSKSPATHYVIFHAAQAPKQAYPFPATKLTVNHFAKN